MWIVWCSHGVKAFNNVINLCNYYLAWPMVCDKHGFIAYKMLYCMCKNLGALGVY